MQKLLLILFIFSAFQLQGQSLNLELQGSEHYYFYKISKEEAEKLYRCDLKCIDDNYFHTLVDSTSKGISKQIRDLPVGQYLRVFLIKNEVRIQLETSIGYHVTLLNNQRDLQIRIQDRNGVLKQNLNVFLKGKKLTYSDKDGAYVRYKSKNEGILRIEQDSFVAYYTLSKDYYYPRSKFKRVVYATPLKYIYRPIRYVVMLPIDIVKSIQRGYNHGTYFYTIRKLNNLGTQLNILFQSKKKVDALYPSVNNFIVFDKTKYRKTDTIRFKTYLLNIRNKPINIPVEVYFDDGTKQHLISTLNPSKPGVYHHEFTLPDHVNIKHDKKYRLFIRSSEREVLVDKYIPFEDYSLKKHKLELLYVPKEIYQAGNLEFQYQFKDANEFAAINSKVNLTLKWDRIINYVGDSAFIPHFTFLDTSFILKNIGIGKVNLELKNMPAVDGAMTLKCRFTSPDNEIHEESFQINYFHNPNSLDIIDGIDSLRFQYREKGIVTQSAGQIFGTRGYDTPILLYEGELPFSLPLHGIYTRYQLKSAELNKIFDLNEIESGVYLHSKRIKNKLYLELVNPRKLPVNYQLFNGDKLIKRNQVTCFADTVKASYKDDYSTSIQFPWKGFYENSNYAHPHQRNQLFIEVNEPEIIYPGQEVEMVLNVSDHKGKPISGADVTAFSMNGLFEHRQNNIGIGQSKHRYRRAWSNYNTSAITKNHTKIDLDNNLWKQLFGLDSILYYEVINPGNKLFEYTIPSEDTISHILPFVVDSLGRILETHILYIDHVPIYASWVDAKPPYVFKIEPGYHKVKIRTYNHEITLDSIFIQQGKKHIFSLNIDELAEKATIRKAGNSLSSHEFNILSKRMLLLGKTPIKPNLYIKDDLQFFPLQGYKWNYQYKPLIIGPVNGSLELHGNNKLQFSFSNKMGRIFEFEGQYIYLNQAQIHDFMPSSLENTTQEFNVKLEPYKPKSPNLTYQDSIPKTINHQHKEFFKNKIESFLNGDLHIEFDQTGIAKENKHNNWFLLKSISIPGLKYATNETWGKIEGFAPGQYEINIINYREYKVIKDTIEVRSDGLNFYRIKKSFKQDINESQDLKIIIDKLIKTTKSDIIGSHFHEIPDSPDLVDYAFEVSGRIIDEYTDEPIVFAQIKNDSGYLGSTDLNGNFSIKIPKDDYVITIEYVGYISHQIVFNAPGYYTIKMTPALTINEVHVVSYKIPLGEQDNFISIRGSRTESASYFIDGVRVSGVNPEFKQEIHEKNITEFEYLKAENDHFEDNPSLAFADSVNELQSLRSDFRDNAFWAPSLTTDAQGTASFKVKFPDDITRWSTHYIAVNGGKQSGIKNSLIRSAKPILGQLFVPNSLVFGDSVMVHGQLKNYTQDSITFQSTFRLTDSIISKNQHTVPYQNSEYASITANQDTLRVNYEILTKDGYFDGEKRKISVLQPGIMEVVGNTFFINQDTSIQFNIDTTLGPLQIHVLSSFRDLIQKTADDLIKYPHSCSEQLASRLTGLLIYKQYFNHLFDQKKEKETNRIIKELADRFNGKGWSWYSGSQLSWVSHHVLSTLKKANDLGFELPLNVEYSIETSLLKRDLSTDYYNYIFHSKRLIELGYTGRPKSIPIDLDKIELNTNLLKIQNAYIRHLIDSTYSMDTVIAFGRKTYYGGLYFAESEFLPTNKSSIDFHNYYVTLETYDLLKSLGSKYQPTLDSIKQYFFQEYQKNHWINTYYQARILNILIDDTETNSYSNIKPTITWNGQNVNTGEIIKIEPLIERNILNVVNTPFTYIYYFQENQNHDPSPRQDYFQIEQIFNSAAELGKDFNYTLEISSQEDAGYLVVKIPIPGSFTYKEKKKIPGIAHTEYNSDETILYLETLKKGTLEIQLDLIPQFKGTFTINPVQINSMYFPQISGNSILNKVRIY